MFDFLNGVLFGGLIGMVAMCVLQINRGEDE